MLFSKENDRKTFFLKKVDMLGYLKRQNEYKDDMEDMSIEDIRDIYDDYLTNKISKMKEYENTFLYGKVQQIETTDMGLRDYWDKIKEGLDKENYQLIYNTLYELIKTHSFNDIVDMLSNNTDDDIYRWMFKVAKIVLREVQESIMYEAYDMYNDMPDEERYIQLLKLGKRKKSMNSANILPKSKKEDITYLSHVKKYMLSNVLEEEYKKEYKAYFDEIFLKKELIEKILDIDDDNVYDEDNLKPRTTEELRAIKASMLIAYKEQKKEVKKIQEYIIKLKDAISQNDEQGIYFIATDAFKELGYETTKFKLLPAIEEYNTLATNKIKKTLYSRQDWKMYDANTM